MNFDISTEPVGESAYVIALSDSAATRPNIAPLLLAAGLAIDTVFKEKN